MTIVIILPLFSAVCMFILGLFVFLKRGNTKLGIVFSLFCLSVTIWLFGTFIMYLGETDEWAIFWDRLVYVGVVFIPILMYHFGLIVSKFEQKQKKILLMGYILSFFFLVISRTNYFSANLYKYDWGVHSQARFFHHLFLIFFFIYIVLFFINLFKRYRTVSGTERLQVKYILLAFGVLNLGAVAYLPAYGIDFYPGSAFLAELIGVIIITYAIIKYRLMDIRFVLGRGAVYGLSLITIVAFASFLMYGSNRFLSAVPFNITATFILIISILLFQLIFRFFEKLASKYFYYTFYSYQKVLTDLGRKLTRYLNLDVLSSLIVNTMINTMKLDRTVILLRDLESGEYRIQKNIGFREENGISLVKNSFLTAWLERTQEPLVYEEISLLSRDTLEKEEKEKLENLKESMKRIEAALCLPLFIEEKIIGMIVLGNKLSGDPYSSQDIDLLTSLTNQISIALQNARLYDQVQDLSENLQKKVDEQMKELREAYEELKKLDKAKSEFVSIASHQLRTPLTAIKGYISMMLEETYGKAPKKMEQPLKNIYISNERLLKLVNDLLNVSRIEAGRLEMKFEKTNIEKMIVSVIEELKNIVKDKGVYLKFEKPIKPLLDISIDKDKIRQVIMNIVDNAIHYTNQGGITIKIQSIKSKIQIVISDTGEGMTKEEIVHLFESFSRGEAGTRFWTEGAGLGLYVAKKFVDLHQGRIRAESEGLGKGSTFYIELPLGQRR